MYQNKCNKNTFKNQSSFFGQNVFYQLLVGVMGLVASVAAIICGLLSEIPCYFMGTPYFGTGSFLWDAMVHLSKSLLNITTAVVFPLSMTHAYITTDPCNIIQGHLARHLNVIEDYCKKQIAPNESDYSSKILPVQP